jgi:hypothetical protein
VIAGLISTLVISKPKIRPKARYVINLPEEKTNDEYRPLIIEGLVEEAI